MNPMRPTPGRRGPQATPSPRQESKAKSEPPASPASKSPAEGAPAPTAGAAGSAPDASEIPVDTELVEDLGAEYELRGDVIEAELAAAREEAAGLKDRALRTQAEFENYRKRIIREREEERRRAGERLVAEMLPAIDNLERAIDHAEGGGDLKHLLGAVEAVYSQLLSVLGKEGVTVIDPLGQPFDPTTQQAVSQREDGDVPDGTVVEVFQKGYVLGGRVIRTAMVVVSTGGPAASE